MEESDFDDDCFIKEALGGICGCVSEDVVNAIYEELCKCEDGQTSYDASFLSQLIRVYLDSKDFIEHGVAIRGSWLTDKGKQALREIRAIKNGGESA